MDQKYGEFVGVDSLYYAPITADAAAGYTTGTPVYLAPTAEIAGEPKVSTKTTYYDNAAANNYVTEAETSLKLTVANIPANLMAILLGKTYDEVSGRVYDTGKAAPPDFALGFRLRIGPSKYRYYWFLKGNFSGGAESAKTVESDVEVKNYELTFTALVTTYAGWSQGALKRIFADTSDVAFDPTGWFSQVQTPDTTSAPSAIALSSIVPADDATNVARSSTIVLTFNNKIADDSVTVISAAGVIVAGAKTYDAAGKILTFTPSSQLASSTTYIVAVAGVVDIYGQALADTAKNFTTAS